jgi:hypothetical protein
LITIYHLNMSRSERMIWLMEELGLPYKLEKFQRGPEMLAPAALKQVSPLGKAPAIRDGDLTLIESARSSSISSIGTAAAASAYPSAHRTTRATCSGCTSRRVPR